MPTGIYIINLGPLPSLLRRLLVRPHHLSVWLTISRMALFASQWTTALARL